MQFAQSTRRGGRRSVVFTSIMASIGVALLLLSVPRVASADETGDDLASLQLARAIEFINELTDRRRVSQLFPNPQPLANGVAVNFVNSRAGNATFINRDLVLPGRMPLVLGRVYDSSLASGEFGAGWKLLPVEWIRRDGDGFLYRDANNGEHRLRLRDRRLLAATGSARIEGEWRGARIVLRDAALTRHFTRDGWGYRLTRVEDAYGNWVEMTYEQGRLVALHNSSGARLALSYDDGRVVAASASTGGSVAYRYDDVGRLHSVAVTRRADAEPVTRWRFAYEDSRLTTATDGDDRDVIRFEFDRHGRTRLASQHGRTVGFAYHGGTTTVFGPDGRAARIEHATDGTPARLTDFGGNTMALSRGNDGEGDAITLSFNGQTIAQARVQGGHLRSLALSRGKAPERYVFDWRDAGALAAIRLNGQPLAKALEESVDGSSRLTVTRGSARTVIERDDRGGVRSVAHNTHTMQVITDEHGLVRAATWPARGTLGIEYAGDGSVEALDFNGKLRARFSQDSLGLRTESRYADDLSVDYRYDHGGNMRSLAFLVDGDVVRRDEYQIGPHNELTAIVSDSGGGIAFAHDVAGRLTHAYSHDRRFEVSYDAAGQIAGAEIDREQVFADGYDHFGQGLVLEADERTPVVYQAYSPGAGAFGSSDTLVYNRPVYLYHPALVFDERAVRLRVVPVDAMLPDVATLTSLARRGLRADIGDGTGLAPWRFDKPSNSLFIPPEFAAVNCYVCIGTVFGHSITIDAGEEVSVVSTTNDVVVSSQGTVSGCYEPTVDEPFFAIGNPVAQVLHRLRFDDGASISRSSAGHPFASSHDITVAKRFPSVGNRSVNSRLYCSCGAFGVSTVSRTVSVKCQSRADHVVDGCSIPEQIVTTVLEDFGGSQQDPVGGDAGIRSTAFGLEQGAIPSTARHLVADLPCNRHDICYQTCGASRARCDSRFEQDMLTVCRRAYGGLSANPVSILDCPWNPEDPVRCAKWFSERVACPIISGLIYSGVRAGGSIAFSQNQERYCTSDESECSGTNTASRIGD